MADLSADLFGTAAPTTSSGRDLSGDLFGSSSSEPAPNTEDTLGGRLAAGGEAFARGLPSTAGFFGTAGAAGVALVPVVASIAPAAPHVAAAIEIGGPIIAGMLGAGGVGKVTDWLSSVVDPEGYAKWKETQKQYPGSVGVGEFASGFAGSSYKTAAQEAAKWWTKPSAQRAISGGAMFGLDVTQQAVMNDGNVNWKQAAAAGVGGTILPGSNVAGNLAHNIGARSAAALKGGKKPVSEKPPPENATQSEKDAYREHIIAKRKAVMESQPLVETAIKNKENGEIEHMGPKHDEARKEATKDTHEQGFMDAEGNFLTREEAYQRALKTGMLDKTHALEFPDEGLHSGDLRNAGHTDFQLSEEQKAGVPRKKDEAPINPALKQMYEEGKVHDEGIAGSKTISGLISHLSTKYGADHYLTQVLGALGKHLPQDMPVTILNRNEMAAFNKENGLGETSPGAFHPTKGIFLEHGKGTNSIVGGHEIAHSIMKEKLHTLEGMSATHPEYAKGQALLSEVKGIMDDVNKSVDKTSLSSEQIKALDYALKNTHEFISDGLFNPSIMKHLLALEEKRPSGFLSKVVNAIGKFFGMKPEEYTALHKLLGTTQKIAKLKVGVLDKTSNQALAARKDSYEDDPRRVGKGFKKSDLTISFTRPRENYESGTGPKETRLNNSWLTQQLVGKQGFTKEQFVDHILNSSTVYSKGGDIHDLNKLKSDLGDWWDTRETQRLSQNEGDGKELTKTQLERKAKTDEMSSKPASQAPPVGDPKRNAYFEKRGGYYKRFEQLPPKVELPEASNQAAASRLSQEIHDQLGKEGIAVAHSSPYKFSEFDWIKHALKGEGAMVKGAGTYWSTKDSTDRGYHRMAKEKAAKQYMLDHPEVAKKYQSLLDKKETAESRKFVAYEEMNGTHSEWMDLQRELDQLRHVTPETAAKEPGLANHINWLQERTAKRKSDYEKAKDRWREAFEKVSTTTKEYDEHLAFINSQTKTPTYHGTFKTTPERLIDWESKKRSNFVNRAFETLGIKTEKFEWIHARKDMPDTWFSDWDLVLTRDEDGNFYIRDYSTEGERIRFAGKTLEEATKKAQELVDPTGEDLYRRLSDKLIGSAKDAKAKYIEMFPDERNPSAKNIKLTQELMGEIAASQALAKEGVHGNVHDAQFGTEKTYRNYVSFDDTLVEQNLVSLGSRGEAPLEAPHSTTERLRTEPIETPEKPDHKVVKSWDELVSHGERVLFEHGEEAALKFFDEFKDFQKTWGKHQAGVNKLVLETIQAKSADERLNVLSNKELEKAITTPEENTLVRQAIENGKVDTLPQKLRDAANRFKSDLKSYWERANNEGVIHGYIENYFPHMLDWVGGPEGVGAPKPEPGAMKALINSILGKGDSSGATNMFGMDAGTKRDLKRSLDTIEDLNGFVTKLNAAIEHSYQKKLKEHIEEKAALEEAGKFTGHLKEPTKPFNLKVKTESIVEGHKIYTHALSKAIANKKFLEGLKDLRDEHGNAVLETIVDGKMPFGWKQIDSPQLASKAVHPDIEPSLKLLFDAGPGQLVKALLNASQAVKRFNVIGSFFHAKSLLEVLNSAKVPLWTPLYHGIAAPLAEKAIKATTGKEVRLSAISKAIDAYKKAELGDSVDKWVRESGLVLEVPEDVTAGILTNIGKSSDELIGKYGPKTRILEKSLSTVEKYTLGMFDKYTWDYLHTGIKLHVAESYLSKQREQAIKSGKPFDEAKARSEIASFVNNAAGGLNWAKAAMEAQEQFAKRMADSTRSSGILGRIGDKVSEYKAKAAMSAYSPQGRRALQVVLFAPDWTISTLRAFTSALPEKMNPTQWHPVEGIKGMAVPTTKADYARLYQFKTALMYFTLLNAINMMTANRPIWDNKDPTRIEWPDGTSMQAMKHAMEPYHWIMDPDKTFANKLGFIPKAMIMGFGGVEYASPTAPKLVDLSATGRLKAVGGAALPFQAQAATNAPEGEGVKRAVLGTLGFTEYGSNPAQRKDARAEREKALKKAAKEYHQKAKEKGWE